LKNLIFKLNKNLVFLVLCLLIFYEPCKASWYNGNWLYRKKFTVQHSKVNGDLTDFPVYLKLNDFGADFFDNVKNDGGDIVITDNDEVTKLNREIEFITTTNNQGALWFKAPNLYNTSNSIFYIYYGNPTGAETNSTSTWKSSYQLVAHLQETPTSDDNDSEFQDSSSNNYDAKSKGSMNSSDKIAGQIGNGVDLDGSNDYLELGAINSLYQNSAFTLSAWIKASNTTSVVPIFAKSYTSVISLFHDGTDWKGSSDSGGGDSLYHSKTESRNTNWTYSVMVYDANESGNNRFKIYVNGNLLTGMSYSTISPNSGADLNHLIAGYQNSLNYTNFASAQFDELRVSDNAHGKSWIQTEYSNQSSPSGFYSVSSQENNNSTPPSISSLSPVDGATNVAIDSDLIISFSENIDTQSGNLVIKKSSDNSTAQTISITSATGNGTSSLTFNPSDFAPSTSYYVQIDASAIDDLAGNSFAGISDSTTWNFTTAPITGWMNNDWTKRVKFTVDDSQVNGSLSNFPVFLRLSDFSSTNMFNNTRSDGADIRITQGDGLTVLASELVQFNAIGNLGELHFKAPNLSNTANMDFYMYYGNSNARPINASDPLGKHDVWSNGFVAVYHMQENPNGDATNAIYNSAVNKYYGTPYGSMTSADRVAGQLGNGTDFDGVNDYFDTADISEIDNATKMTYSIWFKRRNKNSRIHISKGGSGTINDMSDIYVSNTSVINLYWRNGAQNEANFNSNDTNWHHLLSVFNGTASTSVTRIIGYFDGNQSTLTFSGKAPTKLAINSSRFLIGKRNYDNNYSDGFIDEVRISKKLRSNQWAKTEFRNQNSPSTFYQVSNSVTTNSSDNRPKISKTYPNNYSTQIPLKANLTITFNENVTANTGNIIIKQLSNDSTFQTIAIGSGNVSISGATVTINPTSDFSANTEYYVLLDSDLVRGACGSSGCYFSGIYGKNSWRFKTTESNSKNSIFQNILF
jgi:hypothetical protein